MERDPSVKTILNKFVVESLESPISETVCTVAHPYSDMGYAKLERQLIFHETSGSQVAF
tara:strand:+ start:179 stop:355 length:177 start_codon:yes stop_codon:yes gene_type:complete